MHRRNFLYNTGLLAGASLLMQQSVMAQIFGAQQGSIRMLRRNTGIFTERGGTIGFAIAKDGIVAIDSQFADTAAHFIEQMKKDHTQPFKYLLNTHHHGDHTGGNIAFKGLVQNVVAHENALANLKATAEKQNSMDKQLLPDLTFKDEFKLKLEGEKIKSSYFGAGHTNGDAMHLMEEAEVVHMGDLMFNKRHPFVDRTAGANMANWIKVLDKAAKEYGTKTIYIFGHSLNPGEETGTAEDLKKFGAYLGQVLKFAETEFKRGVSKEEFLKNTSIPGNTEWSGQGIERPLGAAYDEVSTPKKV